LVVLKVEIGGGPIPLQGFVNVDCMKHPNVHHTLDLNKDKLPFDDNSVDEIYSSHCLEHLDPCKGFVHCIEEMYRVSKPDAVWNIKVPYAHSHHSMANPFHTNNIFNEYTFHYFSAEPKWQDSTGVRKGSISEEWLLCTLEVQKVEFKYFSTWEHLYERPEKDQAHARQTFLNVVNEIKYTLRAKKPDFWTTERKRLGLIP
jgi:ubiquinone/menaquinone biosynthesis C-methylase UbiE